MNFAGYIDEISRQNVQGWAVDRENPAAHVEIIVRIDGVEVGRCVADQNRPGLGGGLGEGFDDFHAFAFRFSPQLLRFKAYNVSVEFVDGSNLPGGVKLLAGPPRQVPFLQPVLITSQVRSGVAMLIRLFDAHPGFVVADTNPNQVRLVNYFVSAQKVMTAVRYPREGDIDFIALAARDSLLPAMPWNNPVRHARIGRRVPIEQKLEQALFASTGQAFRDVIQTYYDTVRVGVDKRDARFFVEVSDVDEDIRIGSRVLMGDVKEIMIVQDPRDFLAVAKTRLGLDAERRMEAAINTYRQITEWAEHPPRDVLMLRYEDIVDRPAQVLAELTGFLGVPFNDSAAFGEASVPVGIWRDTLSADEVAQCTRSLASAIERFGDHRAAAPITETAIAGPLPIFSLAPNELMLKFESIGENCEFGLVQRRCGAEPLDLLRFASAPLDKLMKALKARFAGMGKADTLEVQESSNGREYMVLDRKFGFLYHAWVNVGDQTPAAVHERETRRVPFLIRKLLEDLTDGEKIFVYHGMDPLTDAQAVELAAVIASYGPGILLWLELADEAQAPGQVIWRGKNLLKAHIDRFAPGEDAYDISLECWMEICAQAYAMCQAAVGIVPPSAAFAEAEAGR